MRCFPQQTQMKKWPKEIASSNFSKTVNFLHNKECSIQLNLMLLEFYAMLHMPNALTTLYLLPMALGLLIDSLTPSVRIKVSLLILSLSLSLILISYLSFLSEFSHIFSMYLYQKYIF